MEFLWVILGWLLPADPVRQCMTALREQVAGLAAAAMNRDCLVELARDPAYRIELETAIIDLETTLHLLVGARACQIAGLRAAMGDRTMHPPTRPKSVPELLARLGDLARAIDRIEHLARQRAIKLQCDRDAPLHFAREPQFSLAEGGGSGSRALARETEGAGCNAAGCPRGPPLPIVDLHPQPASQGAPARSRAHGYFGAHGLPATNSGRVGSFATSSVSL